MLPHPDDESIGCPATFLALHDAGYETEVLACSLGRSDQAERREAELLDAAARGDFGIVAANPPLNLSQRNNVEQLEQAVESLVLDVCREVIPVLVLAPHPQDVHPAHELVGRAVARALTALATRQPVLWLWSIWADLGVPTLFSPFDELTMSRVLSMLEAHRGEVARNDYRDFVAGRATANRVMGTERIFGFGCDKRHLPPYAELLTELSYEDGVWVGGRGRMFDSDRLRDPDRERDLSWLFERRSYAAEATSRGRAN